MEMQQKGITAVTVNWKDGNKLKSKSGTLFEKCMSWDKQETAGIFLQVPYSVLSHCHCIYLRFISILSSQKPPPYVPHSPSVSSSSLCCSGNIWWWGKIIKHIWCNREFRAFAVCWITTSSLWVIAQRVMVFGRRFGTPCRFHLLGGPRRWNRQGVPKRRSHKRSTLGNNPKTRSSHTFHVIQVFPILVTFFC